MSKFNKLATNHPDLTYNLSGGIAFKTSPERELYLVACSALIEDKYYSSDEETLLKIKDLVSRCDLKYVLQLANYARNKMHLRSLPVVLLAEASRKKSSSKNSRSLVRQYTPKIIRRADEPAELVAYWIENIGEGSKSKFPNALKKGLSDAFASFDEYQLAKYNRKGLVTLKDVVNIVHPKPATKEKSDLYRRLLDNDLKEPFTWETVVSKEGSSADSWNKVAPSMGIMALVRNLRNFERHEALDAIEIAISTITNPEKVIKSKLLPFRWYSAYVNVTRPDLKEALCTAMDLSLANVRPWKGTTAIFCDTSGSMSSKISGRSDISLLSICGVFGAIASSLSPEGYHLAVFDRTLRWLPYKRSNSFMDNVEQITKEGYGLATYGHLTLQSLVENEINVDRVVLLSDMELFQNREFAYWAGRFSGEDKTLAYQWKQYQNKVNSDAKLYTIDLAGYGTVQTPDDTLNAISLSGWSESVLDLVNMLESSEDVVDMISKEY